MYGGPWVSRHNQKLSRQNQINHGTTKFEFKAKPKNIPKSKQLAAKSNIELTANPNTLTAKRSNFTAKPKSPNGGSYVLSPHVLVWIWVSPRLQGFQHLNKVLTYLLLQLDGLGSMNWIQE